MPRLRYVLTRGGWKNPFEASGQVVDHQGSPLSLRCTAKRNDMPEGAPTGALFPIAWRLPQTPRAEQQMGDAGGGPSISAAVACHVPLQQVMKTLYRQATRRFLPPPAGLERALPLYGG